MACTTHIAQCPGFAGQPVVTSAEEQRRRHHMTIYKLGITELVLGVIFCLSCLASLAFAIVLTNEGYANSYYYESFGVVYVSPGFWCGIFPIISGILGICVKNNFSAGLFIGNMVMSIFTAIFMTVLLGMSITSAIVVTHPAIITFQVLNSIGSFAILVVSIIHSAYCCAGVCCVPQSQGRVLNATPGQQFIQLPNGQYMLVQNQPLMPQSYLVPGAPNTMPPPGMQMQAAAPAPTTSVQYPQAQMPPLPVDPSKQPPPQMGNPPSYTAVNYATNPNYPH